jgi:sec-independent protein translocase protein TatA
MTTLAITLPGGAEWGIILLIFVLLFGARKLPELGSSVGKTIKNFKRGVAEGSEDDQPEAAEADAEAAGRTPVARDTE